MWSSNALRLRTRSSTLATHHVKKRWQSGSATQAISPEQFKHILAEFYLRSPPERCRRSKVGLAVSGGVDSMALASLYTRAKLLKKKLPDCHAFIIDHKVRPESTEEAEWVKEQLHRKLNIPATIIPLTWPKYGIFEDPSSRFETDARRLRYQALGRACKEHDIHELLVAHHADDQVETVLMRLMSMRWRSGLQGMPFVDAIPECYGIHGVHQSGQMEKIPPLAIQVEAGGVQILRPLLTFRKDQLIATCEEHSIPWAEDKTNQDHTLTPRNTIRRFLKEERLPAALSFDRLYELGDEMRKRVDRHKKAAEMLLKSEHVKYKLNAQTGMLSIRFPPASALLDRPILTEQDKDKARNTAYMLLARVANFVACKETISIGQASGVLSSIWPELRHENEDVPSENNPHSSVCAFGLLWRKWNTSRPLGLPGLPDTSPLIPLNWLICRQPPTSIEVRSRDFRLEYPPVSDAGPLTSSPWQLFDRWWFKIKNHTENHTAVVRFLTSDELRMIRARDSSLDPYDDPLYNIRLAVDQVEPDIARRSLPALFFVSPSGEEQLFALPTLGVKKEFLNENHLRRNAYKTLVPKYEVEVRYKHFGVRARSLNHMMMQRFLPRRDPRAPMPKKKPLGRSWKHKTREVKMQTDADIAKLVKNTLTDKDAHSGIT